MVPTDRQARVADTLASSPNVSRAVNIPTGDNLEVLLYDRDDVLLTIACIHPHGTYTQRPGFRLTTNRRIGHP